MDLTLTQQSKNALLCRVFTLLYSVSRSRVRVVSSPRSGMGKSLFVQRMVEKLQTHTSQKNCHLIIPIHGPVVNVSMLLDLLEQGLSMDLCTVIHIDIAESVSCIHRFKAVYRSVFDLQILSKVETVLFSLVILGGLCDSKGRMWRCHERQMYAIEVTADMVTDSMFPLGNT